MPALPPRVFAATFAALCAVVFSQHAGAQDGVAAGELTVEPPTLNALGFEWLIEGDDDRDSSVAVAYRPAGETTWREGLPLMRLQREAMNEVYGAYSWVSPNMYAGSVFDLEPATAYELRLTLADPDGVEGEVERLVTVSTRAEPRPSVDGQTFHVYPPSHEGEKLEPSFPSLLAAYYTSGNGADWFNAYPPRVQPGDTIVVHAGVYTQNRQLYARTSGTLFDGTYRFRADGTAERPIAIVAAGDGEVVFDGEGNHVLFDVMAADHHYFEGLTFRNTDVAIQAGHKDLAGAVGLTVKASRFENVGRGVYTDWSGAKDFYIADSSFIGRAHPDRLEGWIGATWQGTEGFPTPLVSDGAVKIYGSGHVVTHNFITNFHDGIAHATYGAPDLGPNGEPLRDRMPVSIDISYNDVTNVDDNCVEADGAMHNIRVIGNRCFNQAHRALSAQPVIGGPVYFMRNVVYHAPEGGALKLTADSAGALVYHNTFAAQSITMGPVSNQHHRNNLILPQGPGATFTVETPTPYSSSDYNGFLVTADENAFGWAVGGTLGDADRYDTLEAYVQATGQDAHSVLVDYDVFVDATPPDPNDPHRLYDPAVVDLRLRAGSAAVDAGVALPGVNDGYAGAAPDLGAYELGAPVPHYGPRTQAAP